MWEKLNSKEDGHQRSLRGNKSVLRKMDNERLKKARGGHPEH